MSTPVREFVELWMDVLLFRSTSRFKTLKKSCKVWCSHQRIVPQGTQLWPSEIFTLHWAPHSWLPLLMYSCVCIEFDTCQHDRNVWSEVSSERILGHFWYALRSPCHARACRFRVFPRGYVIIVRYEFKLKQLDVWTTFLNPPLEYEVKVRMSAGYNHPLEHIFAPLHESRFGLKQDVYG